MPDPEGIDTMFCIVKATFLLQEQPVLAPEQLPVSFEDQYVGEPGQSSFLKPSDVAQMKPSTDILLIGSAHAPQGSPVRQMDVSLSVGPVSRTIRVFGDRVWYQGMGSYAMTAPAPFTVMPLTWERAFGGVDWTNGGQIQWHAENRNPVGTGFRVSNGQKKVEGMRVPNLEDPRDLISSIHDRPAPANFGPICAHWEPRRNYAGTYDAAWQKTRAPYLPKDFDSRFFHLAPPELIAPAHLQGGEPVQIFGATPSGVLRFYLPQVRIRSAFRIERNNNVRPAVLDTVILEPDAGRLIMLWKSSFRCDKQALRVREIEAGIDPGMR